MGEVCHALNSLITPTNSSHKNPSNSTTNPPQPPAAAEIVSSRLSGIPDVWDLQALLKIGRVKKDARKNSIIVTSFFIG
jgi:hypothetical protein